jgi:HEAT repeat protein
MMELPNVLEVILDSAAPVPTAGLTQLSNLDRELARRVVDALKEISFERRRDVLKNMSELAEQTIELNFDQIFRRCLDDEDGEVREAAIEGLWECEEHSLIQPLLTRLREDDEERVRVAAAQSLGRYALLAEYGKLLDRDAENVKRNLLELIEGEVETSDEVRRRAIESIAPINESQVRAVIIETYETASEKLRMSAIYAMGQNGDTVWIPYILEELESDEPELRYEAAGAAGRIGDESLLPPLARMVNDDNSDVQAAAVSAISAIGGPIAERVLKRLLEHGDDNIRELALDAVESIQQFEAPGVDILRNPRTPAADEEHENDADFDLDDLESYFDELEDREDDEGVT